MEEKIKRPPSVWITQILVALWVPGLFSLWIYSIISLGYYGISSPHIMFALSKYFLTTFAIIAPFLIVGSIASWGLLR